MSTRNLLVELFVEELPPKALKKLGEAFATALTESLVAQGLADAGAAVTNFASPRRLGAHRGRGRTCRLVSGGTHLSAPARLTPPIASGRFRT